MTETIKGEAVAGRAATVRRQMLVLAGDLNRNTFDIAVLANEAQSNKYWRQWGFESLGDYGERELGIKERKLQYLARIVRVCAEVGVERTDYEPVKVTKLRSITSLDPDSTYFNLETNQHEDMAEHIVDLIAEAPELTSAEVDAKVAALMGLTGDNAMLTRSYRASKSAYENTIDPALELMRKNLGSKSRDEGGKAVEYTDGVCFEYICQAYLQDPNSHLEDTVDTQIEVPTEETF
jgi:hypothetical protein